MKKTQVSTGFQVPDYSKESPMAATASSKGKAKKQPMREAYPDFTVRGNAATSLIESGLKVGEEFTCMCTFKITEVRSKDASASPEYGGYMGDGDDTDDGGRRTSVEIEVHGIEVEDKPKASEDEDSAEGAVEKFLADKSKPEEED